MILEAGIFLKRETLIYLTAHLQMDLQAKTIFDRMHHVSLE